MNEIQEKLEEIKSQLESKNTIIVLGNGFDVAYDIPTRYSDFYQSSLFEYFVSGNQNGRLYDLLDKIHNSGYLSYSSVIKDQDKLNIANFIDYYNKKYLVDLLDEPKLSLDDLDLRKTSDVIEKVCVEYEEELDKIYIINRGRDVERKWADLEEMLSKYSVFYEHVQKNHVNSYEYPLTNEEYFLLNYYLPYKYKILKDNDCICFKEEFKLLRRILYLYLTKWIDYNEINNSSLDLFTPLVKSWSMYSESHSVYTFNYTNTYHRKVDNNEYVKHLHGENDGIYQITHRQTDFLGGGIVLGISSKMAIGDKDKHSFLYKKNSEGFNNNGFSSAIENADKIIVYGCSIGDSDAWYFEKMFQQKEPKTYEIYYYGENDRTYKLKQIEKFCGMDSLEDFQDKHKLIMIDTKGIIDSITYRVDAYKQYYGIL